MLEENCVIIGVHHRCAPYVWHMCGMYMIKENHHGCICTCMHVHMCTCVCVCAFNQVTGQLASFKAIQVLN